MAWLNTTPDRKEGDKSTVPQVSRRESYTDAGIECGELPECDAMHLLYWLIEMGVTQGEGALTFTEMAYWQGCTGIELQPWESRMMKRLSTAYLMERDAARKPNAEAPWPDAPCVKRTAEIVAAQMKQAVIGLTQL